MTSIFMNVDRMRHVAREMRGIAEAHERRVATLRGLLRQLQEVWIGPSPEQYVALQEESLALLGRSVWRINELAEQLEEEIYKYEAMDHLDGGFSGGGGASSW